MKNYTLSTTKFRFLEFYFNLSEFFKTLFNRAKFWSLWAYP